MRLWSLLLSDIDWLNLLVESSSIHEGALGSRSFLGELTDCFIIWVVLPMEASFYDMWLRLKVAEPILTHPWSMFSVIVRIVREVVPVVNCAFKEFLLFQTLEVLSNRLRLIHLIFRAAIAFWWRRMIWNWWFLWCLLKYLVRHVCFLDSDDRLIVA